MSRIYHAIGKIVGTQENWPFGDMSRLCDPEHKILEPNENEGFYIMEYGVTCNKCLKIMERLPQYEYPKDTAPPNAVRVQSKEAQIELRF